MGVDIYAVTEFDEKLGSVSDGDNLFARHLVWEDTQGFRILKYIDPWGLTVLNRLQMPEFLEDLEQLMASVKSDPERAHLRSIYDLGKLCLADFHQYLRFVGD